MSAKILSLLILPSLSWATPNLVDGKILYDESCAKCHHTPYQSLGWNEMTSKMELSHVVSACSEHFQLEWNGQDIEDTSAFLNAEFFFLDQ